MKKKYALILFVFFAALVFAEKVEIRLFSQKNNKTEAQYYDENTERFSIGYGSYVSKIENLEKLKNLKEVEFIGTAFLKDFSFLKKCKNLEIIILYDVEIKDFSFLYSLPNLKILDIQSSKFSTMIDLTKLTKLEYLAMVNCGITSLKDFVSHSEALQYVNVSNNNIMSIDGIKLDDKVVYIISFNPITKNLFVDDNIYTFLPEKFRRFIR